MLQVGCCCGEGPSCEEELTCWYDQSGIDALMCCGQRAEITVPAHLGDGQYEIVTYETSFVNISHIVNGHHGGQWFYSPDNTGAGNGVFGLSQPPGSANARVHFMKSYDPHDGFNGFRLVPWFGNWQPTDADFWDETGFRQDLWTHFLLNSGNVSCGSLQFKESPGNVSWRGEQIDCCCDCFECIPNAAPAPCFFCDGADGDKCECGCAPVCPTTCFDNGCPANPCNDIDNGECTCGEYIISSTSTVSPTDRGTVSFQKLDFAPVGQGNSPWGAGLQNPSHPDWGPSSERNYNYSSMAAFVIGGSGGQYAGCPGPDITEGYSHALKMTVSYRSRTPDSTRPRLVAVTTSVHSNCLNVYEYNHPCIRVCWGASIFGSAQYGTPVIFTDNCQYDLSCVGIPDYCAGICGCPCECHPVWSGQLDDFCGGQNAEVACSEVCDCGDPSNSGTYIKCSAVISYGAIPPVSGLIS